MCDCGKLFDERVFMSPKIPAVFVGKKRLRCYKCPLVDFRNVSPIYHHDTANKDKTHCKRGHKFDEKNTAIRADRGRRCRTCSRHLRKESYQRVKVKNGTPKNKLGTEESKSSQAQ